MKELSMSDYIFNNIKLLWNYLFKYKLSKEEQKLYESILNKDTIGYSEWYKQTKGDDICGHWIKDITKEEISLLNKIHKYFYGEDWCVNISISNSQVCAIMLNDIKDKVK